MHSAGMRTGPGARAGLADADQTPTDAAVNGTVTP